MHLSNVHLFIRSYERFQPIGGFGVPGKGLGSKVCEKVGRFNGGFGESRKSFIGYPMDKVAQS